MDRILSLKMVKYFQSIISEEARQQFLEQTGQLPDAVIAAVGGGSNAIGAFSKFVDDNQVKLIGVEAAGKGIHTSQTAATIANGSDGIFHSMKSKFFSHQMDKLIQCIAFQRVLIIQVLDQNTLT